MNRKASFIRCCLFLLAAALLLCSASPAAAQGLPDAAGGKETVTSPSGTPGMPSAAQGRPWKGEAEAGLINATGNSRSESLRARLKVQYAPGAWKHAMTGDFIRIAERGVTTTEQYNAAVKSDRSLSVRSFLFASVRYETDRLAGYSPRVAESAGYGRRFPFSDRTRLEAETGLGGRHTWSTDGSRQSEAIVRIAVRFFQAIGAQSEFTQEAFSEFGEKNVHTESQTSLKARINADFSMKVNVTVKHDTVVAIDRYKTDTITSVTLVYDL